MNLGLCQHDACACGVLDREFGFSVLAGDSAYCAAQVVAVQGLHVFDFKSLQEKIVETQQRDGCKHVRARKQVNAYAGHHQTRQIPAKKP